MIRFLKAHGNGNDFVVIDEFLGKVIHEEDKASFSSACCHRKFGVGADGVLYLQPSQDSDIRMRIFNSDGTEAEMCGNGIRCLVRYAAEAGYVETGEVEVETGAGNLEVEVEYQKEDLTEPDYSKPDVSKEGGDDVKRLYLNDESDAPVDLDSIKKESERLASGGDSDIKVKVNMGKPLFKPSKIPVKRDSPMLNEQIEGYEITACNTGVPHVVAFVEDVDKVDVEEDAPPIRHSNLFPDGTNVNFAEVIHTDEDPKLKIRTFERGVERETLSCGTGSVASAAVAKKLDVLESEIIDVETKGGPLKIIFDSGSAYMEGGATNVFEGELDPEGLKYFYSVSKSV